MDRKYLSHGIFRVLNDIRKFLHCLILKFYGNLSFGILIISTHNGGEQLYKVSVVMLAFW